MIQGGWGGGYPPARKTAFGDCTLPLDPHWSFIIDFKEQQPNPGTWAPGTLIMHIPKPCGGFAVELTAIVGAFRGICPPLFEPNVFSQIPLALLKSAGF